MPKETVTIFFKIYLFNSKSRNVERDGEWYLPPAGSLPKRPQDEG